MDPEANYEEQRAIYGSTDPDNVERRAELIHAMRDWIRRGGAKPRGYVGPAWEPKSNLPARLSKNMLKAQAEENDLLKAQAEENDLLKAQAEEKDIGATIGDDADDLGPDTKNHVSPNAIDDTFAAYVDEALFSSTDENYEPLDLNYDISNIDQATKDQMLQDVAKFLEANIHLIGDRYEQTGKDFWITRNGHGGGFLDGGWPEPIATILADAARAYGEFDIAVGNGGKIYH
jgi:hypothetical protein